MRTDYSSFLNDLKMIFIFVLNSLMSNKLNYKLICEIYTGCLWDLRLIYGVFISH